MFMFRNHKYTWAPRPGSARNFGLPGRHTWELVGPQGGVEFTASMYDGAATCGIEFHHFEAGDFFPSDEAPHHLDCDLTGGRCWHDGNSTYATETLWPIIKPYLTVGDHDAVFRLLEREYNARFNTSPQFLNRKKG